MNEIRGLNPYFRDGPWNMGTNSEQDLVEDLIIESMEIWGQEVYYVPRNSFSGDRILGEDRLSEFNNAYLMTMYFENVDNLAGQGAFLQKFGLTNEYSATLVVARKRWLESVESDDQKVLPNRPSEGDLIYFPLTNGLFEIKFVQDKDPLFQLGKLYTWKIDIELFQYSSEKISTGLEEIDKFEEEKSHDIKIGNTVEEPMSWGDNLSIEEESSKFVVIKKNPLGIS